MAHSLIIESQKRINVTEVKEVNAFVEKEIKVTLLSGEKLIIIGNNLKIVNFAKETGNFVAEGLILGVKYLDKNVSFFKKLVK